MTENLNLRGKRIFIKNYENLIYYVKSDDEKYVRLIQMNCDKNTTIDNLKLLDNTNNTLIYKHFNETNSDNYKILKLYKKSYATQIIIITNLYDIYTITKQINNNIFYYSLHYDFEHSLFNTNVKRLIYKNYLKNTIESLLSHINSNEQRIISLRNIYYKLHIKCLKDWQIDILKEDCESHNKYLILVQKYEHNIHPYRDTLKEECPVCITNTQVHTFYRCEHYICSECYTSWNCIKLSCSIYTI